MRLASSQSDAIRGVGLDNSVYTLLSTTAMPACNGEEEKTYDREMYVREIL
jgi:hypothetical protein